MVKYFIENLHYGFLLENASNLVGVIENFAIFQNKTILSKRITTKF